MSPFRLVRTSGFRNGEAPAEIVPDIPAVPFPDPGKDFPGNDEHAAPENDRSWNEAEGGTPDGYQIGDSQLVPVPEAGSTGTSAEDRISTVGRAVAQWAAEQGAVCLTATLTALQAHLEKPGTMTNAFWNYKPRSLADHHEYARSRGWVTGDQAGSLGRYGEFTLHTIGRLIKITGNGMSVLSESPVLIWASMLLAAAVGIAFAIFVIR
jgi:hypothetical protein